MLYVITTGVDVELVMGRTRTYLMDFRIVVAAGDGAIGVPPQTGESRQIILTKIRREVLLIEMCRRDHEPTS
jgi:hypothetical protein